MPQSLSNAEMDSPSTLWGDARATSTPLAVPPLAGVVCVTWLAGAFPADAGRPHTSAFLWGAGVRCLAGPRLFLSLKWIAAWGPPFPPHEVT